MITINFTNVTAENAAEKLNNMQQVLDENIELEYESGVIFEKSQRNLSKHQIYIRGNGKHKGYFRNQKYDPNKRENTYTNTKIEFEEKAQKKSVEEFKELLNAYKSKLTKEEIKEINKLKYGCKKIHSKEKSKISGKVFKGVFYEHLVRQNKESLFKERYLATILASKGFEVYLTKELRFPPNNVKQIDGLINGIPMDFKVIPDNSKNGVRRGFGDAMRKPLCMGAIIQKRKRLKNEDLGKDEKQKESWNYEGFLAVYVEEGDYFEIYDIKKEAPTLSASIQGGMEKPLASSTSSISKSIVKSREFNNILQVNIDPSHKNVFEKALRYTSLSFGVPLKAGKGEGFIYKAHEDLCNMFAKELTEKTRIVYDYVCNYLNLPSCAFVLKAYLTHKGKILYSPEDGTPITHKQWEKFIKDLENFMNRNYAGYGEKLILKSETLGRLLDRMLAIQERKEVLKTPLAALKHKGKSFDWISEDIKKLEKTFDNFTRSDMARVQVAVDSAAQRITNVTDKLRGDMQQIIIDGIKNHSGKSKISQNLFDRCAEINRDFQKIADTEVMNTTNLAMIKEEVHNAEPGKRIYFKRIETIDDNTCDFCKKVNGEIVAWSDVPLENEKIKDDPIAKRAIWEGKNFDKYSKNSIPVTQYHPYCRGIWERYDPEQAQWEKNVGL